MDPVHVKLTSYPSDELETPSGIIFRNSFEEKVKAFTNYCTDELLRAIGSNYLHKWTMLIYQFADEFDIFIYADKESEVPTIRSFVKAFSTLKIRTIYYEGSTLNFNRIPFSYNDITKMS